MKNKNGVIFRELSNYYSNWRSLKSLNKWLIQNNVIGVTNLNTRNLTIKVREKGALKATLINGVKKNLNIKSLVKKTADWSGISDNDLAKLVSCKKPYVYKNITNEVNPKVTPRIWGIVFFIPKLNPE